MPWSLDIHVLDVGVGEATLIIAENPAAGAFKSILIDGGLSAMAPVVHRALLQRLPDGRGPDLILVTHYDIDHSDGIANLLYADNLTAVIDEVTRVTSQYVNAAVATGDARIVARRVTCAAYAAMSGAWGDYEADAAGVVLALGKGPANEIYEKAAAAGLQAALTAERDDAFGVEALIRQSRAKTAAKAVGVAAANAFGQGLPVVAAIRNGLFKALKTLVPDLGRFATAGLYHTTKVIDIADLGTPKAGYPKAVAGGLESGSACEAMPNIERVRTGPPAIGSELFWDGAPPAPGAPYAVVVSGPFDATWGQVWKGPGTATQAVTMGDPSNSKSIGLVIRFNDFTYFTAGDLPFQHEDVLTPGLQNLPLPNGAGGAVPRPAFPPPLVSFKCGHHGADTSTSAAMLAALQPRSAQISCGFKHGHPFQTTLDRLYARPELESFYLTNCRYHRPNVPASALVDGGPPPAHGAIDQFVAGNKARVAGDNAANNLAPLRERGDIWIRVEQAKTTGAANARSYKTMYNDCYPPHGYGPSVRAEAIQTW